MRSAKLGNDALRQLQAQWRRHGSHVPVNCVILQTIDMRLPLPPCASLRPNSY